MKSHGQPVSRSVLVGGATRRRVTPQASRQQRRALNVIAATLIAARFVAATATLALTSGCATLGNGHAASSTDTEINNAGIENHVLPPVFIDTDEAARVEAAFPVHNPRHEPVVVTSVEPTCGCLSADLDSREIAPLGTTTLRVALNMTGRLGPHRVVCKLFDQDGLFQSCRIDTNGYRAVGFERDDVTLEMAHEGGSTIRLMTYARASESLPRVEAVSCDDGALVCAVGAEPVISQDDNGIATATYFVKLRAPLESSSGTTTSFLKAIATTGAKELTARACVRWSVASVFEAEPRLVFFPRGANDPPKQVVIRRVDGIPAQLLKCSASDPAILVSLDDSAASLTVQMDGRAVLKRMLVGRVVVTTHDAAQPEIVVRVVAAPLAPGERENP